MSVTSPARVLRTVVPSVLLTVLLTVVGPAVLTGCAPASGAPERPPVAPRAVVVEGVRAAEVAERSATVAALGVLRRWDARRAAAYAEGSAAALRALYLPASRAGARDLALLRRWTARRLVVRGLVPQVRRAELVAATRGRLVLRVEERYAAVRVTGRSATRPRAPTAYAVREVALRRGGGAWRVATVR